MSKRILVISPIPTHPQSSGNRVRVHRLMTSLKELGHDVSFLYVNTELADLESMAKEWGEKLHVAPYEFPRRSLSRYLARMRFIFERGFSDIQPVDYRYDNSLDDKLIALKKLLRPEVVLVEYIFWSRALECFGNDVLKVLDTHDVFARRHILYRQAGQSYGWYCTTEDEEAKALNRSDVVIAIQDQEKRYFSQITKKSVITVGHITELHPPLEPPSHGERILFVGSDARANVHGLHHFIDKVFPIIRACLPDAQLQIVGTICNVVPDVDGCVKLGSVDALAPLYRSAQVVVNPIQFSTGLSIKTMEALGYGKPVVATSAGTKGLEDGAGKAFIVANVPEEFAQSVVTLVQRPDLAHQLAHAAQEFITRRNQESLKELRSVLNT